MMQTQTQAVHVEMLKIGETEKKKWLKRKRQIRRLDKQASSTSRKRQNLKSIEAAESKSKELMDGQRLRLMKS